MDYSKRATEIKAALEGREVAILLASAAAIAVLVGVHAALLSSSASGKWQDGLIAQVKQGAFSSEEIGFVYQYEVPAASQALDARFRAQELYKAAQGLSGPDSSAVLAEVLTASGVARTLSPLSPLSSDPHYQTEGGFDVARLLVDDVAAERSKNPGLASIEPGKRQTEGDRLSKKAIALIAVTVIMAAAFLFASLAQAFPGLRRQFLRTGGSVLVIGLVIALSIEVVL